MKRIFTFLFTILLLQAQAQNPGNFTISGTATTGKLAAAKVYLQYQLEGNNKMDSADFANGQYTFKGTISEPVMARLRVKYLPDAEGKVVKPVQGRDLLSIFLSSGAITVNSVDSFSNATIKGSAAHDDYTKLTKSLQPVSQQMDALYKQYEAAGDDAAKKKQIEDKADSLDNVQKGMYCHCPQNGYWKYGSRICTK